MNHPPYLTLTREPFFGFMPEDVTRWLETHQADEDLALALSAVSRQTGMLMHLASEDDPWSDEAFERWEDVERALREDILARMRCSNAQGLTSYALTGPGWYPILRPFMEKHGFTLR